MPLPAALVEKMKEQGVYISKTPNVEESTPCHSKNPHEAHVCQDFDPFANTNLTQLLETSLSTKTAGNQEEAKSRESVREHIVKSMDKEEVSDLIRSIL